jgi:ABC-type uncharacterized transport system ATPase subunit
VSAATSRRADVALRHLLESPSIADRTRPMLAGDTIDWPALLQEADSMSGGQRLLVHAAHELWEAPGNIGVSHLARGLDRPSFERLVTSLRLLRGEDDVAQAIREAA